MLVLALSLLSSAHATPLEAASPSAPGVSDTGLGAVEVDPAAEGLVVGGRKAAPGDWPDVAFLWLGGGLCTGTLVHPQWVLTAGHCVLGSNPQTIVLGATSFADLQGFGDSQVVSRDIVRAVAHPAYEKAEYGTDIALVKLADPVRNVAPSPIARDCVVDRELKNGADVFVVGWGSTTVSGNDSNYTLNAGKTVVQTRNCAEDFIDGMYTGCDPAARPGGEVGAGGNGTDACFGDSGGPLYLKVDGVPHVVGVTSRAYAGVPSREPCGHGGIYTRPDAVLNWIEKTIGEDLPRPVCTDAPTATAEPVVAASGRAEQVKLHVDDPDGQAWTVTVKQAPAHGTVEVDGAEVVYVPDSDFEGDDAFVLTVTDDGSTKYPENPHGSVDVAVQATVSATGCGCATGGDGALGALGLVGLAAVRRRRR